MSSCKGREIQFKSWQSYRKFERAVKQSTRYIYDSETTEFLNTVCFTLKKRTETIRKGSSLLRAQIGNIWERYYQDGEYVTDEPAPYDADRMIPKPGSIKEGRVNPRGIPCLYLAAGKNTNQDRLTAVAEVRPWMGAYISVAVFKVARDLSVVDCRSKESGTILYIEEPSPFEREKAVWQDIDRAFAKPIDPSDTHIDYVPTQIIAELFRENSFDGIVYRSSLGPGFNIALFDLDLAKPIKCFLYEVNSIHYEVEKAFTPYQFRKYTTGESS